MDGVEILTQTEVIQKSDWEHMIILTGVTFMVVGIIIMLIGAVFNYFKVIIYGIIFTIVSFVVTFFICSTMPEEPSGRYEYQVTIGNNVSFTEFYQKYEIIDQNGKIWTIRDKKNE